MHNGAFWKNFSGLTNEAHFYQILDVYNDFQGGHGWIGIQCLGLAWIFQNRNGWWQCPDVAATVAALHARKWLWRPWLLLRKFVVMKDWRLAKVKGNWLPCCCPYLGTIHKQCQPLYHNLTNVIPTFSGLQIWFYMDTSFYKFENKPRSSMR